MCLYFLPCIFFFVDMRCAWSGAKSVFPLCVFNAAFRFLHVLSAVLVCVPLILSTELMGVVFSLLCSRCIFNVQGCYMMLNSFL
jgi:hypothetical protein